MGVLRLSTSISSSLPSPPQYRFPLPRLLISSAELGFILLHLETVFFDFMVAPNIALSVPAKKLWRAFSSSVRRFRARRQITMMTNVIAMASARKAAMIPASVSLWSEIQDGVVSDLFELEVIVGEDVEVGVKVVEF